jgi:hypothetical protein
MSDDSSVGVVVEHPRGVLAERLGVRISTADPLLNDDARAQRRGLPDRAVAIVAPCSTDESPLPRRLYPVNDDTKGAA